MEDNINFEVDCNELEQVFAFECPNCGCMVLCYSEQTEKEVCGNCGMTIKVKQHR